ncbi:hypothetical protein D3C76_1253880 [compost metagenome]
MNDAFDFFAGHLVQHNGKDDRGGEDEHDLHEGNIQRVSEHAQDFTILKDSLKVIQANEFAGPHPFEGVIVLEGDDIAENGYDLKG